MPKIAIDYSTREVSFYKFVCNDPEIKSNYVGSTVDFTKRKASHKSTCNNPNIKDYTYKIYQTIRENGGWEEWRMIEIEKRIVKDKREAERIEQEWIDKLQSDMNSHKAYSGCETKVEYDKQYYKQYYLEHKEEVNEKRRQHHLENREKLNERRRIRKLEKKQQSI